MWTASIDGLREGLTAEPLTASQIAGQLAALQAAGVGYWPDMTEDEWMAALSVWRKALSAVPAPFALEAFEYWGSTYSRRPAPGDIRNRAHAQIGQASGRIRHEQTEPVSDVSIEDLAERENFAEQMAAEFPMLRRVPK